MFMEKLILAGVALLFLGILLIFAGTILSIASAEKNVKIETAGVIMIGPIPIMFGDKRLLIPLALLAIALMLISYWLFWRH
ncbi:MAG: DUF131 domain-containing protein [Candidatus Diapherotrites archaeon]|nr:DUF131 domain-containing protein [Candidatus Diapherotrites archaeon]